MGLIRSNAILGWNYRKFEEYLARPDTRLMVIGYGFADDHINASIVEAYQKGALRLMYPRRVGSLRSLVDCDRSPGAHANDPLEDSPR